MSLIKTISSSITTTTSKNLINNNFTIKIKTTQSTTTPSTTNNNTLQVDIVSQSENILEIVHPDDKTMFSDAFKPMPSLPGLKVFSCRMGLMKHPRRNHAFDKYKV